MKGILTPEWSRRHGVLLELSDDTSSCLYCRRDAHPQVIMNILRNVGLDTPLKLLDDDTFSRNLVDIFQDKSSQASDVMADIGNELDMYQLVEDLPSHEELISEGNDAPIVRLINAILNQAIKERASDIHIETFERHILIRFRIDGILRTMLEPERRLSAVLVSRIKIMARLDIAEKRMPQDGRISLRLANRAIDVRVSVLPSSHGERIVLRILDKQSVQLELPYLGMALEVRREIMFQVARPNGIVLVTGPTGSGKSTTLYAMLNELDHNALNIMTIEDPVEYDIDSISQTQVNPKVDMTFANGLRAILRQDPDVILIGEIRDQETAQIAVQASLTGHKVLSTLHTNTAVGAVTRLQDMGVEPFLLASSLNAVLAQRLVRRLCEHCRLPHMMSNEQCQLLGIPELPQRQVYTASGCEHCHQTGYAGRIVIQELLLINDMMRNGIHKQKSESELVEMCEGYVSLRQDGCEKVLAGLTSAEEVIRTTGELNGYELPLCSR